jgi:hypothetical protein
MLLGLVIAFYYNTKNIHTPTALTENNVATALVRCCGAKQDKSRRTPEIPTIVTAPTNLFPYDPSRA